MSTGQPDNLGSRAATNFSLGRDRFISRNQLISSVAYNIGGFKGVPAANNWVEYLLTGQGIVNSLLLEFWDDLSFCDKCVLTLDNSYDIIEFSPIQLNQKAWTGLGNGIHVYSSGTNFKIEFRDITFLSSLKLRLTTNSVSLFNYYSFRPHFNFSLESSGSFAVSDSGTDGVMVIFGIASGGSGGGSGTSTNIIEF
ncbi:MAG: hypothetical protein ABIJ18_05740 [archaeon]